VNGISELFRALGPARLGAIAVVGLGLIGFFFFISMRLSTPNMAMLYNNLDMSDSAAIVGKLEAAGVPYQIGNNGATIMVPDDKVLRLRMTMAEQGIPTGGSIGYEIFDRNDHLGTSSFVQSINHVRALEGELSRTIRSINVIENARVNLVLPERELFSRESREPSASIVLKTRTSLSRGQVAAITNLVAAAVPGLQANRISIVDQMGRLLAKGQGDNADALASSFEDKQTALKDHLRNSIEELLEKSVGAGKVRAEVSADIDLDRVTTNSESYDPDGQVVRSTVTVNDSNSSLESGSSDAVSVAQNLPENQKNGGAAGPKSNSSGSRTEETINYEITKTIKTQIQEAGTIKRLSVAVLVDGTYTEGAGGKLIYKPRSKEELDKLTTLVRSAVGYDEARGDKVEVVNMKFAETAAEGAAEPIEINLYGLKKEDMFRAAQLGILGIVGVLVVLLVLRPLVIRLVTLPEGFKTQMQAIGGPVGQAQAALPGPGYGGMPEPAMLPRDEEGRPLTARQLAEKPGGLESAIDLAAIEGKVQGSAVKKVGDLVERHPEEAAAVIRTWLFDK
jgi:flagellar M-ring protein FliF